VEFICDFGDLKQDYLDSLMVKNEEMKKEE
jgi:hypothetical protein